MRTSGTRVLAAAGASLLLAASGIALSAGTAQAATNDHCAQVDINGGNTSSESCTLISDNGAPYVISVDLLKNVSAAGGPDRHNVTMTCQTWYQLFTPYTYVWEGSGCTV